MADHNALPLVILAEKFASLPGIGMKSAQRLAYHVMSMDEGAVEVTITGKKTIKSLTLKPEVVDPNDIDMLQDLIISAVNEAVNNVESTTESEMGKITGGVSLPGLF